MCKLKKIIQNKLDLLIDLRDSCAYSLDNKLKASLEAKINILSSVLDEYTVCKDRK